MNCFLEKYLKSSQQFVSFSHQCLHIMNLFKFANFHLRNSSVFFSQGKYLEGAHSQLKDQGILCGSNDVFSFIVCILLYSVFFYSLYSFIVCILLYSVFFYSLYSFCELKNGEEFQRCTNQRTSRNFQQI